MAKAAVRERERETTASRIAARRREKTDGGKRTPPRGVRGPKSKGPSAIGRLFKLLVLVAAFVCIGFFVVLVIDVGASLIGSVKLAEHTTIAAVWDKVVARVLDEDVPKPVEKPRTPGHAQSTAQPKPKPTAPRVEERAPMKAERPEDDARHEDTRTHRTHRTDPEVERAKKRLDEILGRL